MNRPGSRRPVRVVAVGMIALLAASCGGAGDTGRTSGSGPVPEPTEPVTVTFASWVGGEGGMKKLYKKFRKEHPNITVKFQNIPAERIQQKLTAQIAGGNPPDTAYVDASTVASFASREALMNLDNYLKRSDIVDRADYVDAFKTFVTHKGGMYGLPFDGESTGLFYRTDMFKAAGIEKPPATWDEFEAAARKLTKPAQKQYGYQIFAPESAYYWYPWLWQAGGDVLSDDEKSVEFTSGAAKKAAEFYVGLNEYSAPDYVNSNSYDGRVAFANGQVGMYMAGAWFAGVLDEEFPKLSGKWDAAPLPEGEAGCATTIAGDALVVLDGSKHADAAWKWIEFLSKPENVANWTYKAEGTLLPPLQSLLDSPDLETEKPVLTGFAEMMECGVSHVTSNPDWPKIEEVLTEKLGEAIYGDKSAADALDEAAAEAEKIIGA